MRLTVNSDRAPDNIASAAETLLPAALAKNNDLIVSS
jgi:hypothetical protein